MASTHKNIRSSTADKRPTTSIAEGQIALNINAASPGLFFKDSTGTSIIKAGPVHVGTTAPNATPPSGGSSGNSTGEVWLDTSLTPVGVKIWNGSAWVNATPIGSTTVQGLLELATNAETQTGSDTARAVTPAGLQSKMSDSTSTTSSTTIASSTAVKAAYDLAAGALPAAGGTITGAVTIGSTGSLNFEGATSDAFETTLAVTDPTADRTVTIPDQSGNVLVSGNASIVNADVSNSAAIAGTKITPDFGSQNVTTTGNVTINAQGDLRFGDADSSNWVALQSPSTVASNVTWTLPSADGTTGQVLSTNGTGTLSWATAGGGGGLTHFVESENTTTPNATVPVDALTATDASYTNIDVALVAKGTGSTLAQIPDNTSSGGNKRGDYCTDLQKTRASASRVAQGFYSTITGGYNNVAGAAGRYGAFVGGGDFNQATLDYSTVVGGSSNSATGSNTFIGAGSSNQATATRSTVVGGLGNTASQTSAFIGGGETNTASGNSTSVLAGTFNTAGGTRAFIGAGQSNTTSSADSVNIGGNSNIANASYAAVLGGIFGTTRSIQGYCVISAHAQAIDAVNGVTQSATLLLGRQTTDATPTVLASSAASPNQTNQVTLPNNGAYGFTGEVIAGVTGGGNTARWEIKGAIKRGASAGTTTMVGTPTVTMTHNDAGASGWAVAVTADTTYGCIKVQVTGQAGTTIRWVCKINTTEMSY